MVINIEIPLVGTNKYTLMVGTDIKNTGYVTQIIGPVLDVVFPSGQLPKVYNAIKVNGEKTITCEVQQLLGNNKVRAVAMSATDGLKRQRHVAPALEYRVRSPPLTIAPSSPANNTALLPLKPSLCRLMLS